MTSADASAPVANWIDNKPPKNTTRLPCYSRPARNHETGSVAWYFTDESQMTFTLILSLVFAYAACCCYVVDAVMRAPVMEENE